MDELEERWDCARCGASNAIWLQFCSGCGSQHRSVRRRTDGPQHASGGDRPTWRLVLAVAAVVALGVAGVVAVNIITRDDEPEVVADGDRGDGEDRGAAGGSGGDDGAGGGPVIDTQGPGADGTVPTDPGTPAPPAELTTPELIRRLRAALPEDHELGSGWVEVMRTDTSEAPTPATPTRTDDCPGAPDPGAPPVAAASAAFDRGEGATVIVGATSHATPAEAAATVGALVHPATVECMRAAQEEELREDLGSLADTAVVRVEPLAVAAPVDGITGIRFVMEGTRGETTVQAFYDIVAFHRGRVAGLFFFVNRGVPAPNALRDSLVAQLVERTADLA